MKPDPTGPATLDDGTPPTPPTATPLLAVAWRLLAVFATLLALFLGVGFALSGTWESEREVVVAAPPSVVFPYVNDIARWSEWSPWPQIELAFSGPSSGTGARMNWDDPFVGDGEFVIDESMPDSVVRYSVAVQGGSITTEGELRLSEENGGTRVTWREVGDFGWNPLMGYAALSMDRTQGTELERALGRLKALVEAR